MDWPTLVDNYSYNTSDDGEEEEMAKGKVRRFTYTDGTSNKFWEVEFQDQDSYVVTRRWGRIGTKGQSSKRTFSSDKAAEVFIKDLVSKKLDKGYKETKANDWKKVKKSKDSNSGEFFEKPEVTVPKKITLPKTWSEVKVDLTGQERAIYEKHDDSRTKQRRQALVAKHSRLLNAGDNPSEEMTELRKTVWILLRCAYLRFLLELNLYKPDVTEGGRIALGKLAKELEEIPTSQKAFINKKLSPITSDKAKGGFSIGAAEKGIDEFVTEMIQEVEAQERVGFGGVNRARAKRIALKLKQK